MYSSLKQYVGQIFPQEQEIKFQCCCMPACIRWQQKPKAQNVGHEDLLSQKEGAEKKLFLGTEFQELEVSCYSLGNEKGT